MPIALDLSKQQAGQALSVNYCIDTLHGPSRQEWVEYVLQPGVFQSVGTHQEVWPEYLPAVLQRVCQGHWIHQGESQLNRGLHSPYTWPINRCPSWMGEDSFELDLKKKRHESCAFTLNCFLSLVPCQAKDSSSGARQTYLWVWCEGSCIACSTDEEWWGKKARGTCLTVLVWLRESVTRLWPLSK